MCSLTMYIIAHSHAHHQINPGCMKSTVKPPVSAMKDQFKDREGLDNSKTIDKTMFRKKVGGLEYIMTCLIERMFIDEFIHPPEPCS